LDVTEKASDGGSVIKAYVILLRPHTSSQSTASKSIEKWRTAMKPALILMIFLPVFIFAQAKDTTKAKTTKVPQVSVDTLVSRTALINLLQKQVEQVQNQANIDIASLRGWIGGLEVQTSDSVRVKKAVFHNAGAQ
jgi:hypothetical protein